MAKTQTEIGEEFGMSSVDMGKKLVELNLKNKETGLATDLAIEKKLAKNIKYIKNDKVLDVAVWNNQAIKYIRSKTKNNNDFLSEELLGKFMALQKMEDSYSTQGNNVQQIRFNWQYEEFLKIFKKSKETIKVLFYKKLEENNLVKYARSFDIFDDLEITLMKEKLSDELLENNVANKRKMKI
jgi:hypothetical protein